MNYSIVYCRYEPLGITPQPTDSHPAAESPDGQDVLLPAALPGLAESRIAQLKSRIAVAECQPILFKKNVDIGALLCLLK